MNPSNEVLRKRLIEKAGLKDGMTEWDVLLAVDKIIQDKFVYTFDEDLRTDLSMGIVKGRGEQWFSRHVDLIMTNKKVRGDCVEENERIWCLRDGKYVPIEIKYIEIGDMVMSYDFNEKKFTDKKVTNKVNKGTLPIFDVKMSNRTSVKVTENHNLWTKKLSQKTGLTYEKQKLSSAIKTGKKTHMPFVKKLPYIVHDIPEITEDLSQVSIKSVTPCGEAQCYDITVEDTSTFVFEDGLLGHNCDDYMLSGLEMMSLLGFDQRRIAMGLVVDETHVDKNWAGVFQNITHAVGLCYVKSPTGKEREWHFCFDTWGQDVSPSVVPITERHKLVVLAPVSQGIAFEQAPNSIPYNSKHKRKMKTWQV